MLAGLGFCKCDEVTCSILKSPGNESNRSATDGVIGRKSRTGMRP